MVCLIAPLLLNESLWRENSKCIVRLMGENSWQMTLVCFRNSEKVLLREIWRAVRGQVPGSRETGAGLRGASSAGGSKKALPGQDTDLSLSEAGIGSH